MNNPENVESSTSDIVRKTMKVIGGAAGFAILGYTTAKGLEQIVDINSESIGLYEVMATGGSALIGAFVTSESVD